MTKCGAVFRDGLCELQLGHVGAHDVLEPGPRCKAKLKGESCAYELGHDGAHWTITEAGEETWCSCSDCGGRNIEPWSPYERYCYYCGSKGLADVGAPWLDALDGIEKELVLLAVYHRDGDLTPRALQWLHAQKGSSRT